MININGDITVPAGTNLTENKEKTLILNSKLTVEGNIEVNGSVVAPPSITRKTKMASTASTDSNAKLEMTGNGTMSVKDGSSMQFDSFADIITPTQNSVLLYAGAKVSVSGKQYIGDSDALIKLSNFSNSTQPVAGYFLNGDGKLLLVIFEKAEVLQTEQDILDIGVLVKAGGVNQNAGELTIPNFNIINPLNGSVIIEANASLTEDNKAIVTKSDTKSVFNATGGDLDNRRGVGFFKYQDNSILAIIRGDVTMNKAFNTAIIKPEYSKYNDFYKSDLNSTLDIKFNPEIGDLIGGFWGASNPVEGKYDMDMVNNLWEQVRVLAKYNAALVAVTESNYTVASWEIYQAVVAANVVTATNTQAEIDAATLKITTAQNSLITLVAANQDQTAPAGLEEVAPTSDANNDGKITGTTTAMQYKLVSADDKTYVACSEAETTVSSGDYEVRFAAKTGYNSGVAAPIKVLTYGLNVIAPITDGFVYSFKGINIDFDDNIQVPLDYSKIKVTDSNGLDQPISGINTTISTKELQINCLSIVNGEYTITIPKKTIVDMVGERYNNDIDIKFNVKLPN